MHLVVISMGKCNIIVQLIGWKNTSILHMGRPNKRAGCHFFENFINGQFLIRAGRVEFFCEINRRACPFIRQVRVDF